MKKLLYFIPLLLLVLLAGCKKADNGIILYVGSTCSHCKKVEAFLDANKASEKLKYEIKEVFENKTNVQELSQKATACNLGDQVGVPFLTSDSKCYMGEDEVMNFFKQKLNLPIVNQQASPSAEASASGEAKP